MDLASQAAAELKQFEDYWKKYFAQFPADDVAGLKRLIESMTYSALGGGKRFRPLLTVLTGSALGQPTLATLPFAAAIEMIHTYSLIHDDLPVMDNDDFRRGQPTNHKVFGDAMALLAGDALLTEAFTVISYGYQDQPEIAVELIRLLSKAAGARGMVGGQAIDILPSGEKREEWEMKLLHSLKTGALIRAAVEGAAIIAQVDSHVRKHLADFGKALGLAFQVADDLLDQGTSGQEQTSFVAILGEQKTIDLLQQVSLEAIQALRASGLSDPRLESMVKFNLGRTESTTV